MRATFNSKDLSCSICTEFYNFSHRRAMVICLNMHTICEKCAKDNKSKQCPYCKRKYNVQEIVANRYIMQQVEQQGGDLPENGPSKNANFGGSEELFQESLGANLSVGQNPNSNYSSNNHHFFEGQQPPSQQNGGYFQNNFNPSSSLSHQNNSLQSNSRYPNPLIPQDNPYYVPPFPQQQSNASQNRNQQRNRSNERNNDNSNNRQPNQRPNNHRVGPRGQARINRNNNANQDCNKIVTVICMIFLLGVMIFLIIGEGEDGIGGAIVCGVAILCGCFSLCCGDQNPNNNQRRNNNANRNGYVVFNNA